MNFLEETMNIMNRIGKTENDVSFCEVSRCGWIDRKHIEKTFQFSFSVFLKNSNFLYDNGFGGEEIDTTMKIVFKDNSWLERDNYDGSEWWNYNKCPEFKEFSNVSMIDFHRLYDIDDYSDDISKIIMKEINNE